MRSWWDNKSWRLRTIGEQNFCIVREKKFIELSWCLILLIILFFQNLRIYNKLDFTDITYLRFLGGTYYGSYKQFQKEAKHNNNNINNNKTYQKTSLVKLVQKLFVVTRSFFKVFFSKLLFLAKFQVCFVFPLTVCIFLQNGDHSFPLYYGLLTRILVNIWNSSIHPLNFTFPIQNLLIFKRIFEL